MWRTSKVCHISFLYIICSKAKKPPEQDGRREYSNHGVRPFDYPIAPAAGGYFLKKK